MYYSEDTEPKDHADRTEDGHLVLDGTVYLDFSDKDHIPRIKGLIELLNQYLRAKQG